MVSFDANSVLVKWKGCSCYFAEHTEAPCGSTSSAPLILFSE